MGAFIQSRTIVTASLAAWLVAGGSIAQAATPNASPLDPLSATSPSGKTKPVWTDPSTESSGTTYVTVPMDGAPKPAKPAKGGKPAPVAQAKNAAGGGVMGSTKAAGSKIVDGSKAASSKIVDGSKAAGSKIVEGSKQLGDGMASSTKKMRDGISSGAKASGDMFMKGARAFGEGVKTTGQKLKDGSQAVGDKITSVHVPSVHVPKIGGDKKSDSKTQVASKPEKKSGVKNEPAPIAADAAKAASIEAPKSTAPVQTAANNKDKGIMGKTLGHMPKMPKLPFIGGKKAQPPQTASAPPAPTAGVDQ